MSRMMNLLTAFHNTPTVLFISRSPTANLIHCVNSPKSSISFWMLYANSFACGAVSSCKFTCTCLSQQIDPVPLPWGQNVNTTGLCHARSKNFQWERERGVGEGGREREGVCFIHVHSCVCVSMHVNLCMWKCTLMSMHILTHTHTHTWCVCVRAHVHTHMYTRMWVCVCVRKREREAKRSLRGERNLMVKRGTSWWKSGVSGWCQS